MPTCPKCEKSFSIWSKSLTSNLCGECTSAAKEEEAERQRREAHEKAQKIVKGKIVPCPICGHDRFHKQHTLMNTAGKTFFGMDWADAEAETCICKSCGHVLWFRIDPII